MTTTAPTRGDVPARPAPPSLRLPEIPDPTDARPTVDARLRELARSCGQATALQSPGRSCTFADLVERADAWADELHLRLAGTDPDAPVAILGEQHVDTLLAVFGVLAADRPVVIADPLVPVDRLADMFARAGAVACLHDAGRAETAGRVAAASASSGTDPLPVIEITGRPGRAPVGERPAVRAGRPRCVVFTSGSSGRPKAVVYDDGWLLNEAVGARVALGLGPGDRTALVLPATFAAGLTVLMMALLNGATVCAYDPRLAGIRGLPAFLEQHRVSTLHTTPSLLRSLLGVLPPTGGLPGLRLATTCGEAVHGRDITALRRHLDPSATYTSWSGSSETGHLAFHEIGPGEAVPDGIVPVGRPAANKLVRLLDEDGAPVPAGEVGEVTITSAYLCRGYLDDPESGAGRFVPLADGRTRYHMGDLGRLDAEGRLHLLGRRDAALKIRGYLVEPAEVEGALLTHPDIAEAVVLGHTDTDDGSGHLVAFVCPVSRERALPISAVRRMLREKLPEWMVPWQIVQLTALPRNERGKIDRAALRLPEAPPVADPARTPWEAMLIDIWGAVTGAPRVGRASDFTELGGDSLDAEEMLCIVGDRLGVRLSTGDLAQAPTIAEFAARVSQLSAGPVTAPIVSRFRPRRRRPPSVTLVTLRTAQTPPTLLLIGPRSAATTAVAEALPPRMAAHWVTPPADRRTRAAVTLVRAIRAVQPGGPYLLLPDDTQADRAGQAAQRLAEAGESVLLVTPDGSPIPPGVRRVPPPPDRTRAADPAALAARILDAVDDLGRSG